MLRVVTFSHVHRLVINLRQLFGVARFLLFQHGENYTWAEHVWFNICHTLVLFIVSSLPI